MDDPIRKVCHLAKGMPTKPDIGCRRISFRIGGLMRPCQPRWVMVRLAVARADMTEIVRRPAMEGFLQVFKPSKARQGHFSRRSIMMKNGFAD